MAEKILVIDDDIISQNMLRSTLTQAGYSVVMASDGDEGIRKAVEELPNFVILDIMMPGKDGGDVAAALREDKKTKDIPILFLSSLVQSEETRPCRMKDRISFLSKPYNKDSLLNALKRCASYRE